jgi:hypothetical protein
MMDRMLAPRACRLAPPTAVKDDHHHEEGGVLEAARIVFPTWHTQVLSGLERVQEDVEVMREGALRSIKPSPLPALTLGGPRLVLRNH